MQEYFLLFLMRCTMNKSTGGLIFLVLCIWTLIITQSIWMQTSQPSRPIRREILGDELDRLINESFQKVDKTKYFFPLPDDVNKQISKQDTATDFEVSNQRRKEEEASKVSTLPAKINTQVPKQEVTNKISTLPVKLNTQVPKEEKAHVVSTLPAKINTQVPKQEATNKISTLPVKLNTQVPKEKITKKVSPLPAKIKSQVPKQEVTIKISPLPEKINNQVPKQNKTNEVLSFSDIMNKMLKQEENNKILPLSDKINKQVRIEEKTNEVLPEVKDQTQLLTRRIASLIEDGSSTKKQCVAKDHIFFLKVHKCGSSTVQNILMRRGLEKDLTFVLPEKFNYLGKNETFDPDIHIGASVKLPSMKYDIFTHHTRYDATNVKKVMHEDTVRVAILRESSSQYESQFQYYELYRLFAGLQLHQLLRPSNNSKTAFRDIYPNIRRFLYHIGRNQMSYDFGMEPKDFDNETKINELIQMVERDFDLIMISEYMEVSLILLADLMCWPLEEVTFVRLNARKDPTQLTENDRDQLRLMNKADTLLYRHFKSVFRKRVESYGMKKMEDQLLRLVTLNQQLLKECPSSTIPIKNDDPFGFCKFYTMHELRFTNLIRDRQKYKISVLRNFKLLKESN